MTERTPLLQFYLKESLIWYKGSHLKIDREEVEKTLSSLPDSISSDKDKLQFFTYFDENDYKSERKKSYYDFKLKRSSEIVYNHQYTVEESKILLDSLASLYQNYKEKYILESKEKIKQEIQQAFSNRILSLRGHRDELLKESDWTQIPDVPFDEDQKELWKKYRQVLRDLPEEDGWIYNDFHSIQFPIDPATYKLKYPNHEVEYLSTPDQFENRKLQREKKKLLGFVRSLSLPSLDENSLSDKNYSAMVDEINSSLKKIDPDLRIDIVITSNKENEDGNSLKSLSYKFSGYIPEREDFSTEVVDSVAEILDNPDNYSPEDLSNIFE